MAEAAIMAEEMKPEKKIAFANRKYTNEEKRKKEEEELEELIKEQRGETQEPQEAEPTTAEEKTFKKRYGDLRRHMSDKEKEWNEKLEALEARSKREGIVPPKSDEDIEKWASEYPDVAGIVETIAAKKAQEMFNKAESRLQELDEAHSEAQRVKAENIIRKSHEDFDELRQSDQFHDWADKQPKWVKDALYENMDDPASVVRVIDLYKIDNGMTVAAKKQSKKAAASTVAKGTRTSIDAEGAQGTIKESDVAKMSNKEFEEMQDKINEAMRKGKFVYDVSGSAR